ncbi:MAG TPA: Verru_Chthon cassette protein C [Candidatus Methylacidiphilales bacterium]
MCGTFTPFSPLADLDGKGKRRGFTLVEMLVATAILVIIVGILFGMTQEMSKVWTSSAGKIEAFRTSRGAFDALTRTLSQATLNTYYDYFDSSGVSASSPGFNGRPFSYGRQSDLQFVSGQGNLLLTGLTGYNVVSHAVFFTAPLGMTTTSNYVSLNTLLNACGFYVVYGPDSVRPNFLPATPRYRYRLMQFVQASDALSIYVAGNKGTPQWYLPPVQADFGGTPATSNFVLAENVIALILLPKLAAQDEIWAETNYSISSPLGTALAPNYSYDSSKVGQGGAVNPSTGQSQAPMLNSLNQLPPVIQVTMVTLDESSAVKLGNTTAAPNARLGLTTSLFTQAQNYKADLKSLTDTLSAGHLNYRVFQTDVALRAAKWSSSN